MTLIAFLFGTVFALVARKKMLDKFIVCGWNNQPNKEKNISFHPFLFMRLVTQRIPKEERNE